MPWENEDFYNFALWVFFNFNGQIQVQYNSFCTRYRVCGQCFLVCNQNQVLVSRTETKVPFQYRCWSRNFFFLRLKLFFQFFLFNFFNFFQIFKTIQRILNYLVLSELFHIWQQIWFWGLFDGKKYLMLLVTRFSLWFCYLLRYWLKLSANFGVSFGIRHKPK